MEVLRKAFSQRLNGAVSAFINSVEDDEAFIEDDIAGSVVHATMLEQVGLLTPEQAANIKRGLQVLRRKFTEAQLKLKPEFEDVHMNVEKYLEAEIGIDALRLHTARSRNDQVAFDLHRYACRAMKKVIAALHSVQAKLVELADQHSDCVLPGYTHLQRAQPVAFSHVMLSYVAMFERDKSRFADAITRADYSPLGAGALTGSSLPIDPDATAKLSGFQTAFVNSIDAVSDRDFVAEFLSCCSIAAIHVSQLAETLILWSSAEFGYVTFGDDVTTTSSLMPNKKNLDPLEIARAKAGTICGELVNVLMVLKSLPTGYNRDLQETKPPLVKAFKTMTGTLQVLQEVLGSMDVNRETMLQSAEDPFVIATDLVEYLVRKEVPFRRAHEQIASLFQHCRIKGLNPGCLPLRTLQEFAPALGTQALELFDPVKSVNAKVSAGGTAKPQIELALTSWKHKLGI